MQSKANCRSSAIIGDEKNPFSSGDNLSLGVNIERSGRVSLHYQINGRNRLGKGPQIYQFNADENAVLTTTDSFVGGSGQNLIRIALTKGEAPSPFAGVGQVISTPDKKANAKPRGMKVRVSSTFDITNADDSVGFMSKDNTVEVAGGLNFNNKSVWNKSRSLAVSYKKGGKITTDTLLVDVVFDQPDTWLMSVSGLIYDVDDASGSDDLWGTTTKVDLKKTVEAKPGGISTITLPGDRTDENAELYINVEKVGDIF